MPRHRPLPPRRRARRCEPDILKTYAGDLIIQPVNHACLVLTFGSDIIYFDPVGGGDRYKAFNKPTAILITHAHPDHFDVPTLEAIATSAKLIIGPQEVIDALPADLKAKAKLMKNGDTGDDRQHRRQGGPRLQHHARPAEISSKGRRQRLCADLRRSARSMSPATPRTPPRCGR